MGCGWVVGGLWVGCGWVVGEGVVADGVDLESVYIGEECMVYEQWLVSGLVVGGWAFVDGGGFGSMQTEI